MSVPKKYSITANIEKALLNIKSIEGEMREFNALGDNEHWGEPIQVGIAKGIKSIKFFYKNPDDYKYMRFCNQYTETDDDPSFMDLREYKIYNYLLDDLKHAYPDPTEKPHGLNYKTGLTIKLYPKFTFDQYGFLTEAIYYETAEFQTDGTVYYEGPILKVNVVYNLNEGYVSDRTVTREWTYTDGTYSNDVKVTTKIYNSKTAREESRRRRNNVIDNLQMTVVYFLILENGFATVHEAESYGMPLMNELAQATDMYIQNGLNVAYGDDVPLVITKIIESSISWLDNDIPPSPGTTYRLYLLDSIIKSSTNELVFVNKLLDAYPDWLHNQIPNVGITYEQYLLSVVQSLTT